VDFSKRSTQKSGFQRQSMGLFTTRVKTPEPFGWHQVDRLAMVAAFSVCADKGATLSIAPGNGGVGVTVRIYMGEKGDYAYAADAESLNECFELLIAKMGSTSEDVKQTLQGLHLRGPEALPAD